MDTLTFTSNLIQAFTALVTGLAWPAALVVTFFIYRKNIVALLPNIKKMAAGSAQVEMFDPKEIGKAISEIDKKTEPLQVELDKAKEALIKEKNLSEVDKAILTDDLLNATEKIRQLEADKKELTQLALGMVDDSEVNFLVHLDNGKPAVPLNQSTKNLLKKIAENMGGHAILTQRDPMVQHVFATLRSKIESGAYTGISLKNLLSLRVRGIIDENSKLTDLGISLLKFAAEDNKYDQADRKKIIHISELGNHINKD